MEASRTLRIRRSQCTSIELPQFLCGLGEGVYGDVFARVEQVSKSFLQMSEQLSLNIPQILGSGISVEPEFLYVW